MIENRNPKVWYSATTSHGITKVSPDAIGHILWHGIFMCRKSMSTEVRNSKADKGILRSGVIPGNPMCEECQKAYKANPELPYFKWVKIMKGE
jgi:hypothetical protein